MTPDTTGSPLATYREHARRGELAYQYSPDAGRAVFYPRLVCPFTGSTRLEWRVSSGRGVVYSTSTVADRAGDYNVALVDVEEGFRMMARVVDLSPDDVRIGMPVRVEFRTGLDDDPELPVAVFTAVPA